ncbi:hypothetical protein LAX5112_00205 [Roseibium alexandrii]|uniref:Uncharacterized protein n=1 Tax=Roseibium alexandrii TaxID=388408 RepID=A0A0M6ZPA0_9HYPH|nr:hypothetical protein LAX5112_00205 [Roseibium alexandrii]
MNRQRTSEASTNARESAYTQISSRMMFGSAATTASDSPRRRFNIFAANVGAGFTWRWA